LSNPRYVTVKEPPKPRPKYNEYTTSSTGEKIPVTSSGVVKDEHGKVVYEEPKTDADGYPIYETKKNVSLSKYIKSGKAPPKVFDFLTKLKGVEEITFVITDNPADVIRKSAVLDSKGELVWPSCETPEEIHPDRRASFWRGPFSDVEHWNAIVWYYMGGKKPDKDTPSGRVMIRWGLASDGTIDIGVEEIAYPKGEKESEAIAIAIRKLLVEKGYTVKNIVAPYESEAYLDNMHRKNIRERTASFLGLDPSAMNRKVPHYYGMTKPSYGEGKTEREFKEKYIERDGRIPHAIALDFLREPDLPQLEDENPMKMFVKPLAHKDVGEPILRRLARHENIEIREHTARRPFIDLTTAHASQQKWVNLPSP
jgi:hypothetical protein